MLAKSLRAALTAGQPASSPQSGILQLEQGAVDVIRLEIEAIVKRCGGEMRLMLSPDRLGRAPSSPASSLLKAVASGRECYKSIVAGQDWGQKVES
jgi:hypothetical protein